MYAGIGAIAILGYGAYVGGTRTWRDARSAYTWTDSKLRRGETIALPAAAPEASTAAAPA